VDHQAVQFGIGQRTLTPYSWKGDTLCVWTNCL